MPRKTKWTKARREKFMRTVKAKQVAAAARVKPMRKTTKAKNGVHGNSTRTIMIVEGDQLVPYRLEAVRAYVRVAD